MLEEAIIELEELVGCDSDLGDDALGLNGHGKHVLAYTLEVDYKHHVVDLWVAWRELDGDLCLAILGELSTFISDAELVLHRSAVTRDANHIVDVNFRGVRQVDSLSLWEAI